MGNSKYVNLSMDGKSQSSESIHEVGYELLSKLNNMHTTPITHIPCRIEWRRWPCRCMAHSHPWNWKEKSAERTLYLLKRATQIALMSPNSPTLRKYRLLLHLLSLALLHPQVSLKMGLLCRIISWSNRRKIVVLSLQAGLHLWILQEVWILLECLIGSFQIKTSLVLVWRLLCR